MKYRELDPHKIMVMDGGVPIPIFGTSATQEGPLFDVTDSALDVFARTLVEDIAIFHGEDDSDQGLKGVADYQTQVKEPTVKFHYPPTEFFDQPWLEYFPIPDGDSIPGVKPTPRLSHWDTMNVRQGMPVLATSDVRLGRAVSVTGAGEDVRPASLVLERLLHRSDMHAANMTSPFNLMYVIPPVLAMDKEVRFVIEHAVKHAIWEAKALAGVIWK